MFDPLIAEFDSDELARLRREEPVSRAPSGSWFLARFDDVLAATKDPDTFIASFREPGVVVPEEEQLVNEIPRPRHGQIRRIINSAIAAHRVGRIEPFCRDLCRQLLGDILAKGGPIRGRSVRAGGRCQAPLVIPPPFSPSLHSFSF